MVCCGDLWALYFFLGLALKVCLSVLGAIVVGELDSIIDNTCLRLHYLEEGEVLKVCILNTLPFNSEL